MIFEYSFQRPIDPIDFLANYLLEENSKLSSTSEDATTVDKIPLA